jgi:hypothetical protein
MNVPLGIRSCNPWNLQQEHIPWLGLTPNQAPTGELVFDNMIDGIRAGVKLCYSYQAEGFNTPLKFITRYSPATAGNPTAQYVQNVCGWTGFPFDATLDFHDPKIIRPWARAIWRQEQGLEASLTISDDDLTRGIEAAQ